MKLGSVFLNFAIQVSVYAVLMKDEGAGGATALSSALRLRSRICRVRGGIETYLSAGKKAGLPADLFPKIRRILLALDAATSPFDLALPGFRFHQLKPPNEAYYSVRVNGNWHIIFEWDNGDAISVDLVDYRQNQHGRQCIALFYHYTLNLHCLLLLFLF